MHEQARERERASVRARERERARPVAPAKTRQLPAGKDCKQCLCAFGQVWPKDQSHASRLLDSALSCLGFGSRKHSFWNLIQVGSLFAAGLAACLGSTTTAEANSIPVPGRTETINTGNFVNLFAALRSLPAAPSWRKTSISLSAACRSEGA